MEKVYLVLRPDFLNQTIAERILVVNNKESTARSIAKRTEKGMGYPEGHFTIKQAEIKLCK